MSKIKRKFMHITSCFQRMYLLSNNNNNNYYYNKIIILFKVKTSQATFNCKSSLIQFYHNLHNNKNNKLHNNK